MASLFLPVWRNNFFSFQNENIVSIWSGAYQVLMEFTRVCSAFQLARKFSLQKRIMDRGKKKIEAPQKKKQHIARKNRRGRNDNWKLINNSVDQ
jgi:hypothetical protein